MGRCLSATAWERIQRARTMRTHPWAVMLLCLWPTLGGAMEPLAPNSESPLPASLSTWRYLTRLGARLMGVQAEVDVQHLFTGPPRQRGRYTLGLSAVHVGWGRVDVDGRLTAQLANRNLEVALSGLANAR